MVTVEERLNLLETVQAIILSHSLELFSQKPRGGDDEVVQYTMSFMDLSEDLKFFVDIVKVGGSVMLENDTNTFPIRPQHHPIQSTMSLYVGDR